MFAGYTQPKIDPELPKLKTQHHNGKWIEVDLQSMEWTISPEHSNGKTRIIELGLKRPIKDWPTHQFTVGSRTYTAVNVGIKNLEKEIIENHLLFRKILKSNDPDTISVKMSPELRAALNLLFNLRWQAHKNVLTSYSETKSRYLHDMDLFYLWSFDKSYMNSDVFILLEDSIDKVSDLAGKDIEKSLKLTIQVSYKKGGELSLSPGVSAGVYEDMILDTILPFEAREFTYTYEAKLPTSMLWPKIKAITGGSNFAEITRYHSSEALPRNLVKGFLNLAVKQGIERGVDTFLASGDEKTTRLFSIFYKMKTVLQFTANTENIPEYLSYIPATEAILP